MAVKPPELSVFKRTLSLLFLPYQGGQFWYKKQLLKATSNY